jgi:transposase-like protein
MMTLLWLASAVGAALFFVAGWLAGRSRRPGLVTTAPVTDLFTPGPAPVPPELASLRAELAAAQVAQVGDRTTIQQITHDLGAARAQVERLRIDLMRANKQSTDLQSEGKSSAAELSAARNQLNRVREELAAAKQVKASSRVPLKVRAAGHKAGDVLQALVDGVSGSAEIRCAVVADDLGLVVASHGELPDEVAAVGALFGRAGLQAQKVLPLHKVQRVTVEDDQNCTLTLRPLQTDESVEGDLALITLAVGSSGERASDAARSARPT